MVSRFARKLNGLSPLSTEEIAVVEAACSRVRLYGARRDLIREGDEPGPVFVVMEGWVSRYKILPSGSRQIMAFLMPGDACDLHVNMLTEMDHGLQAITAAGVAMIPGNEMRDIMVSHPRIARAMYISQLVDEGIMRAWIVSMGRRSSIERVAHLICELYIRMQNIGLATTDDVSLPLSQVVLADALGMTPVHINRVLRQLRLSGAMALSRGRLAILDPVKLVQVAGFDENYLHRRLRQGALGTLR